MHAFPIISRYSALYAFISAVVIIPGVISLLLFGLRPGIDFVGGTILEFSAKETNTEQTRDLINKSIGEEIKIVRFDSPAQDQYVLRISPLTDAQRKDFTASLSAGLKEYTETSFVSVGPTIGRELVLKTVSAIVISALLIAIYLGVRFRSLHYGLSAVMATLHDVMVMLGTFSLLGHYYGVEIDTLFVTALLTVVSFSVHDTVVVYDRIRERRRIVLREPYTETIDRAVFETLIRSLRNSLAVVLVLLALFLLGGETLRWFAFALLVGTISGTYSSTFVALPLLILWEKFRKKK